jgi:hypothetical protein
MFAHSYTSETGTQHIPTSAKPVPFFQPKLTVNTPGDTFEQVADAITDKVMRMPAFGKSKGNAPIPMQMITTSAPSIFRQTGGRRRRPIESIKAGFRGHAIQVMWETPEQRSRQNVLVFGATPDELNAISDTLDLLPVSHYSAIPRIVVADVLTGRRTRGGGHFSTADISRLTTSPTWRRLAEEGGWEQLPRLELTRHSLGEATRRAQRRNRTDVGAGRPVVPGIIWDTLLHETGHFVDSSYNLGRYMLVENFPNICYGGSNQRGTPCGPAGERFADAYMHYYTNRLPERGPEGSTIQAVLQEVEQQYQSRNQ